jgi:hypothetical protein
MKFRVNGTSDRTQVGGCIVGGGFANVVDSLTITEEIDLVAGDYLEVLFRNGGSSAHLLGESGPGWPTFVSTNPKATLSIRKVGV